MSAFLDRLLAAAPADRVAIHRERWPVERSALAEIAGRVLIDVLAGRPQWRRVPTAGGSSDQLSVAALSDEDECRLAALLRHEGDGRVWVAVDPELPGRIVRGEPTAGGRPIDADGPLASTGVTLLADAVIRPVLDVLLLPYAIACGKGPSSVSGRKAALLRSREAHETLGLELRPLAGSSYREVVAALARSWSVPPDDVGDRVMALLCTWLGDQVNRKVGEDGRWSVRDVVNLRTRRWLAGTLTTPEALATYADVPLRGAPTIAAAPPGFVRERLDVVRELWHAFDEAHANTSSPEATEELYGVFSHATDLEHALDDRVFGTELLSRVRALWGTELTVTWARGRLRTVDRPVGAALAILGLPLVVWDRLGLVLAWRGPTLGTSRPSGDVADMLLRDTDSHTSWIPELDRLGMPIDATFLTELDARAVATYASSPTPRGIGGDEGHWLAAFETGELPRTAPNVRRYEQSIAAYKAAEAQRQAEFEFARGSGYLALRDMVTTARRAWAERHLEPMLDARWRGMLREAAAAHAAARSARTRELTDRQFCSVPVRDMANVWSAGRLTPIARVLGFKREIGQEHLPATQLSGEELCLQAAARLGLRPLDASHKARDWQMVNAHFALRDIVDTVRTAVESDRGLERPPRSLRPTTLRELAEPPTRAKLIQ